MKYSVIYDEKSGVGNLSKLYTDTPFINYDSRIEVIGLNELFVISNNIELLEITSKRGNFIIIKQEKGCNFFGGVKYYSHLTQNDLIKKSKSLGELHNMNYSKFVVYPKTNKKLFIYNSFTMNKVYDYRFDVSFEFFKDETYDFYIL